MKVLFIGGTGNISTAVSRLAIENQIDLYLLNRGNRHNFKIKAKHLQADITQLNQVNAVLNSHSWDAVVNWIGFTEDDVKKDFQLFARKTKQYIFISSASVYQKPLLHPIVTESTPLTNPYWQYSRNKIICENYLIKQYRENGFPVIIVRPSLTYETVIPVAIGGWTNYNIVDRIKKEKKIIVHGDGSSLWTITHARDFARGFLGLLGNQQAIGHAFHITSDEILTWDQIYDILADAVGKQANKIHIPSDFICRVDPALTGSLQGDKSVSAIFDNSKIKRFVPSFQAIIPFCQGIKKTILWFEERSERMHICQKTELMINNIITAYEKAFKDNSV